MCVQRAALAERCCSTEAGMQQLWMAGGCNCSLQLPYQPCQYHQQQLSMSGWLLHSVLHLKVIWDVSKYNGRYSTCRTALHQRSTRHIYLVFWSLEFKIRLKRQQGDRAQWECGAVCTGQLCMMLHVLRVAWLLLLFGNLLLVCLAAEPALGCVLL